MPTGIYIHKKTDAIIRFWEKVDVSHKSPCWEWIGSKDRKGYGQIYVNGKLERAPRFAYEHFNNCSIMPGFNACHKCDNPGCVNPQHIFIGTQKDNIQDCIRKNRNNKTIYSRGDEHYSRMYPERLARGDRCGTHTHPESYPRGEKQWNAKHNETQVKEIRIMRIGGMTLQEIADVFGVTLQSVWGIVHRKSWKHVG